MKTVNNDENAFVVIEIIDNQKKVTPYFSSENASTEYHKCVDHIKSLGLVNPNKNLAVYFVPLNVNNNLSMLDFIKTIEENIEFYIRKPLISYVFKV